jgi:hypothetical protein
VDQQRGINSHAMGMIFRMEQPPFEPGEHLAWRVTANRSYDGVAVVGRLFVTDRRIFFRPTGFEQGLGREGWECSFSDVVKVDLAERELNFFSGGLRRRLRIRTKVGSELFVVWRPRSVAHRLGRALTDR